MAVIATVEKTGFNGTLKSATIIKNQLENFSLLD